MQDNVGSNKDLSVLFGKKIVEQACLIDVADLNLNEEMIRCITAGVTRLKQLKGNPDAQINLIKKLEPGETLLLCMWIMDMCLIEKILDQPHSQTSYQK